jgi:phosphomannomutase
MARLRSRPPGELAGQPVVAAEDLLTAGTGLPPTDALRYRTDGGIRVVVRPSGTEPKLKCYLEAVVPVGQEPAALADSRALAARRLAAVRADLEALLGLSSPPTP